MHELNHRACVLLGLIVVTAVSGAMLRGAGSRARALAVRDAPRDLAPDGPSPASVEVWLALLEARQNDVAGLPSARDLVGFAAATLHCYSRGDWRAWHKEQASRGGEMPDRTQQERTADIEAYPPHVRVGINPATVTEAEIVEFTMRKSPPLEIDPSSVRLLPLGRFTPAPGSPSPSFRDEEAERRALGSPPGSISVAPTIVQPRSTREATAGEAWFAVLEFAATGPKTPRIVRLVIAHVGGRWVAVRRDCLAGPGASVKAFF